MTKVGTRASRGWRGWSKDSDSFRLRALAKACVSRFTLKILLSAHCKRQRVKPLSTRPTMYPAPRPSPIGKWSAAFSTVSTGRAGSFRFRPFYGERHFTWRNATFPARTPRWVDGCRRIWSSTPPRHRRISAGVRGRSIPDSTGRSEVRRRVS